MRAWRARIELGEVSGGEDELVAGAGEAMSESEAEAPGAAGDDDDLAGARGAGAECVGCGGCGGEEGEGEEAAGRLHVASEMRGLGGCWISGLRGWTVCLLRCDQARWTGLETM